MANDSDTPDGDARDEEPTPDEPGEDATPSSPAASGPLARARRYVARPRDKVAAVVALVIVLTAGALAATSGGEEAAPTTTTTTTTSTTTTTTTPPTTAPPPPVYPLTGLPASDPAVLARPSLVVKIDNAQPKARPQIGLNQADIVYEERVEGAVTRFMAVFHSTDAGSIGPVRSGRSTDIGLFRPLGTPLFAWSGANPTFAAWIRDNGIVDVGYETVSGLYSRAGDRPAPHNLMLHSTAEVWGGGFAGATPPATPLFSYRPRGEEPTGGTPVKGVRIVYATGSGSAPVEYVWNGSGWARFQSGTPHVDPGGVQFAPENVVISYTGYESSGIADQFGVPIRQAQLVGRGTALVLTGGQAFNATWVKPALDKPTRYLDESGEPIRLTPGRTWVALPEPGTTSYLPW